MIRDLLHEIHSTLRQNKLRTALTGFAVSWGIFLLIALLGAGNGLMNSFSGNVGDFISQSVSVEGWRTSKPYNGYKEGRVHSSKASILQCSAFFIVQLSLHT